MQLNRLKFEEGNPVKVLSPLYVEPIIYADRYMIENNQEIMKIRKYVQSLRDKIKLLESKLKEYSHFKESDYNIQKILELAATFFKEQRYQEDS
jgi:hypothetical protein